MWSWEGEIVLFRSICLKLGSWEMAQCRVKPLRPILVLYKACDLDLSVQKVLSYRNYPSFGLRFTRHRTHKRNYTVTTGAI